MTTTLDSIAEPTRQSTRTLPRTAPGKNDDAARASQFWRTVWRVHFYAGMLVIPFLLMLAVTGTVILYEEPINNATDSHLRQVEPVGSALPLDSQVEAVRLAYPDAAIGGVTPPSSDSRSTMMALATTEGAAREVYVNPYTGEVLGSKIYHDDIPGLARKLHGNLLFGWKVPVLTLAGLTGDGPLTTKVDVGDLMIELMTCWGIVLVVSGLYLWYPRKRSANKALIKPRLAKKGRARWRDLHAAPGVLLAPILLFLILSGLPWSGFWGGNWDHLSNQYGVGASTPVGAPASSLVRAGDLDRFGNPVAWAARDQPVPSSAQPIAGGHDGTHQQHQGHEAGHRGRRGDGRVPPSNTAVAIVEARQRAAALPASLPLEEVAAAARAEGMVPGFSIALPVDGLAEDGSVVYGSYTVTNPFSSTSTERTIYLDQFTGTLLGDRSFDDYSPMAKATAWAIDVHMGTQYGLINRIVLTAACMILVWSVISGLIMWWKRRPHGKAGLPRRPADPSLQRGLIIIAVVLGVVFPLLGASMVAVVLLDRYVIRRIPPLRRAFGMR